MPLNVTQHMATLGVKTLAIINVDEPFPASYTQFAKSMSEEKGIKVVLTEKYTPGTKDFSSLLQKVKMFAPDALHLSSYLDDHFMMLRQMKEAKMMFPYVYMIYSSMPQWLDIGDDGLYIFGHTTYNKNLNWKVNLGLSREELEKAFWKKYPQDQFGPDFQVAVAYSASVILGKFIETANSLDSDALKKASLYLSGKIITMNGNYEIDQYGKQHGMLFLTTQVQKIDGRNDIVMVWPREIATSKAIYPIPDWDKRK